MRDKKFLTLFIAIALCLTLSACGENAIPELTKEQVDAIGEYAAFTLMKYDANNRSRLVELKEKTENQDTVIELPNEQPTGMGPVDETPIVDFSDESVGNVHSIEEILELPDGVSLEFAWDEACEEYYEDGNTYFKVAATEGSNLFVLHFAMINASETDKDVDILSQDVLFRICVNDDYSRKAMTTGFANDLSTFHDTLLPGENRECVLIIEMDKNIDLVNSISLNIKNESKTYTIFVKLV